MRVSRSILAIAVVVLIGAAGLLIMYNHPRLPDLSAPAGGGTRPFTIEQYMMQTINEQVPVRDASKHYRVTGIQAAGGRGVVYYTDGKNNYVADFTYVQSSTGGIAIDSFVVRT
jgi:hypothetical protein